MCAYNNREVDMFKDCRESCESERMEQRQAHKDTLRPRQRERVRTMLSSLLCCSLHYPSRQKYKNSIKRPCSDLNTHAHVWTHTPLMYQLITVCHLTIIVCVSSLGHGNYIMYECVYVSLCSRMTIQNFQNIVGSSRPLNSFCVCVCVQVTSMRQCFFFVPALCY